MKEKMQLIMNNFRQPKKIKSLSESDLKRLMDQILSGCGTCGDKVKKKVNAILLLLNEICSTDVFSSGIFNSDMTTDTLKDDAIDEITNDHKLSFLPATYNFLKMNGNEVNYLRPSLNQMQRQKKARIMSTKHCIIKILSSVFIG